METKQDDDEDDLSKDEEAANGRRIVSGPSEGEFKEALYAWPDPVPLVFNYEDGGHQAFTLNGVSRSDVEHEWTFYANSLEKNGRTADRVRGCYSPRTGTGEVRIDSRERSTGDTSSALDTPTAQGSGEEH